jgi:hypothetical protein
LNSVDVGQRAQPDYVDWSMCRHVCGKAGSKPSMQETMRVSLITAIVISDATCVLSDNVNALPVRVNVKFSVSPRDIAVMNLSGFESTSVMKLTSAANGIRGGDAHGIMLALASYFVTY